MTKKISTLIGKIKRHPDGFGFFLPDDNTQPDVYIPRNDMDGIMTNDRVEVEVYPERGGDRYRGEIKQVLERGTKQVIGHFYKINDKYGLIKDEGKAWGFDLRIPLQDSMNAADKELVAAEILVYPNQEQPFSGRVTEVIGDSMDPLNDIKRVLVQQNIPVAFSKATLEEAKRFQEVPSEADMKGRKDLRHLNLITIDGATAKDFDDAVYCETTPQGFKLYVAIADVSHYVQPMTAIDKDAYERGTSVYFPNYVVPMLPEVLSNGLCSLNPHVPRLCMVAEMQMNFAGEFISYDFYEAVMESKARVTYGEAQEVIDGVPAGKLEHVKTEILRLADLAKILMAKRFKEGSLDLEIPETQLVIDGAGVPVDIIRSERLFAHRLIEEMMLSANVAVAKFFSEKEAPSLFRIHEEPNDEAIQNLEKYLFNFGGNTKLTDGKLQKRLTKALQEFAGKPEAHILHILTLRSMAQAKYHQSNIGHFGLGFEHYTHFTSPIRRYPDLIVHRTLKSLVCPQKGYQPMEEDDLATAGTHLSACEQRSAKSERQIQAIKKARFMEKHLGEEFEGMVSSVVKFGVFVLLREYDIDGLIRLDDLGNDRWDFDEDNLRLVGKRSQKVIAAGDMMKIQVASADHELGQINFVPLEIIHVEHPKKSSSYKSDERSDSGQSRKKRGGSDRFGGKKSERPGRKREDSRSFSKKRGPSGDRFKKPSESEPRQSFKRDLQPQARPDLKSRPDARLDQKPRSQSQERPTPRKGTEGPNLEVLKMILSPDEFAKVEKAMKEQPVVSRKLQAAFQSRLPPQEVVESTHRKSFSKTKKKFNKEEKPAQKTESKKSSGKSKKRRS